MKSLGIEKMKNFSLAALLVAGTSTFTACSSDNDAIDEQPVKYTMTVNASKGEDAALTRALSLSGSTLSPTWSTDDKVLVYQGETKLGELIATASNTSGTTLSGTLTAAPTDDLTFYYHKKENTGYSGQDGTLATIASTYDCYEPVTVAKGSIISSNNQYSITDYINFNKPKQAIAKFTLVEKNNESNKINATTLNLSVSSYYNAELTIAPTVYTSQGNGIIYLAIPDKVKENNMEALRNYIPFTLTAIVGNETYTLTHIGFPFENGNYYEITAKMTKQ